MSARTGRRLAFGLWVLAVLFVAFDIPLALADRSVHPINVFELIGEGIGLIWASVGALIAGRRGNAIGWLFCAIGVGITASRTAIDYTVYGLRVNTDAPGVAIAAVVGEYALFAAAMLGLLFLLFPDGQAPSPRWRVAGWAVLGGTSLATIGFILKPETFNNYRDYGINYPNPTGVGALAPVARIAILIGTLSAIVGSLAAVVALRYRYKRSTGDTRQQIRWLAYVGGLALVLFVLWAVLTVIIPDAQGSTVFRERKGVEAEDYLLAAVALTIALGVPAAATLAIFKYRLYDIDVVINKTLVYGLLSAVLAGVYVVLVLGLGAIARSIGGTAQSPVVVAASTLAAAALFQPVRRRVQSFIDRRFYRRKVDAERTLLAFSSTLRNEVDLESLRTDLLAVVRDVLQPAGTSLWLRDPEREGP